MRVRLKVLRSYAIFSLLGVSVTPQEMGFIGTNFTNDMAYHVRDTFYWVRRGSMWPPSPLPEDYDDLCPNFDPYEVEKITWEAQIPELMQATFYAMVLGVAFDCGVVSRAETMLLRLCWRACVGGTLVTRWTPRLISMRWASGGSRATLDNPHRLKGLRRVGGPRTEWRRSSHPPAPLPEDCLSLCPDIDRAKAEETAQGAHISKIV
ncbi:hypothetical protein Cgig2_013589 [Carnegiea gigantea]|uniref:Uncharacterized protein n=1 Tax=Carnegiea gigantea TaxID=171969 RepID=A0A9Q1QF81_9CARY|nr:hypothetical protein Cgig2_013589 [Carnegiea gigantea]